MTRRLCNGDEVLLPRAREKDTLVQIASNDKLLPRAQERGVCTAGSMVHWRINPPMRPYALEGRCHA